MTSGQLPDRATAVAAWEALFRAQVAVMRRLGADFPNHDTSFNEYDVLYTLTREPERSLRLRDLNAHVLLTQPSVSRLVDRLAARGLVEKLPDRTDARGTIIRLTDAGYRLWLEVGHVHANAIEHLIGTALTQDEAEQLIALSRRLRDGLPD